MPDTLNVFQKVFSLSLASNAILGCTGSEEALQQVLQSYLVDKLFPSLGPDGKLWEVVWGPTVRKEFLPGAKTGPDNVWFVAFHPALEFEDGSVRPTYVIAVAGTPTFSAPAWIQDFDVSSVVDFRAWVEQGIQNAPIPTPRDKIRLDRPYISRGTATGVHILASEPPRKGAASEGTKILDFLKGVDRSSSPRFITTGHSLGGALSPTLALALVLSGIIPADATLTYPSAGASPGDVAFRDLFVDTLPRRPSSRPENDYQSWNANLVNTLDIVPQAWSTNARLSPQQNLKNVPVIYGRPAPMLVKLTIGVLARKSEFSRVTYMPLPSQYFTGVKPETVPRSPKEFLELAFPQHSKYYLDLVGVTIPKQEKAILISLGLHVKGEEELWYDDPIFAEIKWALDHPKESQQEIDEVEKTVEGKTILNEYLEE